MALKDTWKNKVDGVDPIFADDVNQIAQAVIAMEKNGGGGAGGKSPYIGTNGNWYEWSDADKKYVDTGVKAQGTAGYTPKRGTDYWTPADIAEIKSYVDDAILGGEW